MEEKYFVLIVDDEEDLKLILADTFQIHGFGTMTASNGKEAIEVLRKYSVDAIVSDVRMPEMNGIDLLKDVRAGNPKIPVIFLVTGFADITENEAKKLGVNGMFFKPFSAKDIIQQVKSSINSSRAS